MKDAHIAITNFYYTGEILKVQTTGTHIIEECQRGSFCSFRSTVVLGQSVEGMEVRIYTNMSTVILSQVVIVFCFVYVSP